MGKFWKSSTVLRYVIAIVSSAVAARMGLSAEQTGELTEWLLSGVLGLIAFAPLAWNLTFRPSNAAMDAAVVVDKVIAGEEVKVVVPTPEGKPNIVVMNTNANVGHS